MTKGGANANTPRLTRSSNALLTVSARLAAAALTRRTLDPASDSVINWLVQRRLNRCTIRAQPLQTLAIGGLDPHLGVQRELLDVAAQLARHEVVVIGASAV